MSNALLAGVSGLKAFQTMIDVTGTNLANMDTYGYKASSITFSDLLSETLKSASQSTASTGGSNSQQVGSGVQIASISEDMTQGTFTSTGQELDMAIDGDGFFTLSDGTSEVYTRVGSFTVDSEYYLVDSSTGYRVLRIGSEGVEEGVQDASSDYIHIPYDEPMEPQATTTVSYSGNLSADEDSATTNVLSSEVSYTVDSANASTGTLLSSLDQVTGDIVGTTLTISGTTADGAAVSATLTIEDDTTIQDLLDSINAVFTGSTATLVNGEIRLTDDEAGYSLTDLNITQSTGGGTLELPEYFTITSAGGNASVDTTITVYDSQGTSYTLSCTFVKTDDENTWDMAITSITGDVELEDRRISGITFLADGSYAGIDDATGDTSTLTLKFAADSDSTTIKVDLGTEGEYDGLTQFGGTSTAASSDQDGYESGWLSSISITSDGVLVGTYTNGISCNIATLKVTTFQNPEGLDSIGNNYYTATVNSGKPQATQAGEGSAGTIESGVLESSNVDVSTEFVNLIQAQNAFQANARTIMVANEMLQDLTGLIR